ncbi:hypothetical protein I5C44_04390 [Staphylococcus aureus]|nr:hypothetical protein I5C44_04390 [Staphylococcus aureus]
MTPNLQLYNESNRSKYTFDSYSGDTNLVIDIWSVSDDLGHHDGLVKRCIEVTILQMKLKMQL